MGFWIREIAGWILVFLGLFVFYTCLQGLLSARPPLFLQSGPLTLIGFFVFRGGIHLLKVAVAARICVQAQKQFGAQEGKRTLFQKKTTVKKKAKEEFAFPNEWGVQD